MQEKGDEAINTGFEKFLERKERFGIQFKSYSTRREIDPLQSISGTSQEQASNNVQISENGSRNFNNESEKLKKTDEKIIEKTTKAYKFEIIKEMGVVGLDEDIQSVASQLITGNKHVVCVVGLKGIGKTSLAKNIYRHSDILDHFPARAWVTLTDLKTNDYDAIFEDVAKQVSEPDINGSQEEENRREKWKNKVCDLRFFVVYMLRLASSFLRFFLSPFFFFFFFF